MNVLYVGAHADDFAIGCAGTILKRGKKDKSHYAIFSLCGNHSGLNFTAETLRKELLEVQDILGIEEGGGHIWDFENTRLWMYADTIRERLETLKDSINPELIYVPMMDRHQDHQTVAQEAMRAFRQREIRTYELGAYRPGDFKPNLYVDITEQLETKKEVMDCWRTQNPRPFFKREAWKIRAEFRGMEYGALEVKAAEAFEIIWQLE